MCYKGEGLGEKALMEKSIGRNPVPTRVVTDHLDGQNKCTISFEKVRVKSGASRHVLAQ